MKGFDFQSPGFRLMIQVYLMALVRHRAKNAYGNLKSEKVALGEELDEDHFPAL